MVPKCQGPQGSQVGRGPWGHILGIFKFVGRFLGSCWKCFGSSRFDRLEQLARLFPGGKITKAPTVAELKQSMLFILRAGNSGPRKDIKQGAKNLKPLWNRDQLSVGDHFSSISYLKV